MTSIPKTGVWFFPEAPAPQLVEGICHGERLGLDEVWIGDEGPAREPFAILAAAAQATSDIGLGIGITNPYVRHPALAVTSALTVHELSAGRVILGVGAGGQLSLAPFGLQADRPLRHVAQFLETAYSVRAGRAGAGYAPPDTAITGEVAKREMPIYVGGRGPRFNRLASANADGAFVAGLPPFRYGEVIGWARETNDIDIALYPSVAFDDASIEHHRPQAIWSLIDAPEAVSAELNLDRAVLSAAADELQRGNSGPARAIVTDELLPQLMLTGSPSTVGARLAHMVQEHRPTSIGLALLQPDLEAGLDDVAATFGAMREILQGTAT